jgi:hypothetical protein
MAAAHIQKYFRLRGEIWLMKNIGLSLLTVLALTGGIFAATMPKSTRFQGTVAAVSSNTITVSTSHGRQTVALDSHTRFLDLTKSSLDKVNNGSFIGTTVVPQPDGSYKSTEVHIFAEALRGMGEGFTKMNSSGSRMMANSTVHAPGNMMANSTIRSMSSNAGGKTISMTFPGQKITVHIPANVPVSFISQGGRSLVRNGKTVLVICNGAPNLTARTVVVIEPGASLGT